MFYIYSSGYETHAAHHDIEVAVDHDGTPASQVDILLPPITDLQAVHLLAPTTPLIQRKYAHYLAYMLYE